MTVTYDLILRLADTYPVERLCECLDVSKSALYAYRAKRTYQPSEQQIKLMEATKELFYNHERRYGSRRLVLDLQKQGFDRAAGADRSSSATKYHQRQSVTGYSTTQLCAPHDQ